MLLNLIRLYGRRSFSKSNICRNLEKSKVSEPASTSPANSEATVAEFIPSEWDRKVLVWSGRYKSKDIPPRISYATLDNARSRLRIKLANILMVGTLFLCAYYIWRGKENRRRGDTFISRDIERRKALSSIKNE